MNSYLNAAHIQDLYHYALAMKRDGSSAFRCDTLRQRFEAIDNAVYCLKQRNYGEHEAAFVDLAYENWDFCTVEEMEKRADELMALVQNWSKLHNVDPRTGERLNN